MRINYDYDTIISVISVDKVYSALQSNGYPSKFIFDVQTKKTQLSTVPFPEELDGMIFLKLVDPFCQTTLRVSTLLQRCVKKYEITVLNKLLRSKVTTPISLTTWHCLQNSLRQLFTELYRWDRHIICYEGKRTLRESRRS